MRTTNSVLDLLRHRRAATFRCPGRARVEHAPHGPDVEGVIYLTPDGDGYVLYAPLPIASR